jgi:vitamin B12 transporter
MSNAVRKIGVLLCSTLSSLSFPLAAQAQTLGEVVVTATREPTPEERALADITVIDAQTIRAAGAASLPELLQTVPGIEIYQSGPAGSVAGVFIRGNKIQQTLVLVDGMRFTNPMTGMAPLELLPLASIDRIEVLRGPASALYGSGAVGGVIQITTRERRGPPAVDFSALVGSRHTAQTRVGVSGGDRDWTYSLALSRDTTRGFNATNAKSGSFNADDDGARQSALNAALSYRFAPSLKVGMNLFASELDNDYDAGRQGRACLNVRANVASVYAQANAASRWLGEFRLGESGTGYDFCGFDYAPRTRTATANVHNTWVLQPELRALFGLEQIRDRIGGMGVSYGAPPAYLSDPRERDTDSVYAGLERDIGDHQLRGIWRHDRITGAGSENSGSLGWGWRPQPAWLLRAGLGSAFRAPTFNDLLNPDPVGNPNFSLVPERAVSSEIAVEHQQADRFVSATLFRSRIRDAIEIVRTVVDGFDSYETRNLDVARVLGITLSGRRSVGAFTVRANGTWQDPEREATDPVSGIQSNGPLARRARHHGNVGIDWREGAWRSGLQWRWQGQRMDSSISPERMGAYGVLDASLSRQMGGGWQWFVRGVNLTDKVYETAYGYTAMPRSFFAGFRLDAR